MEHAVRPCNDGKSFLPFSTRTFVWNAAARHVRLVLLKLAEFAETTIARADNPNGSPGAESRVTKVNPFGETREPLNIYGATVSGIDFMVTSTWPSNNELRGGTGLSEPRRSRSIAFPVDVRPTNIPLATRIVKRWCTGSAFGKNGRCPVSSSSPPLLCRVFPRDSPRQCRRNSIKLT